MPNPLNLKGSFWETGELYTKPEKNAPMIVDPDEQLSWFAERAGRLESLAADAEEGRFEELSRALRGGSISESQIRVRSFALIDYIEDERNEYLASAQLRAFFDSFDALDRIVYTASRTLVLTPAGYDEARIDAISYLDATTRSLRKFNKIAGEAIASQRGRQ